MSIADKITRAKTDYDEVYDAGKQEGKLEGKQAEYDRFWDALQDNGNRWNYNYAFAAPYWTEETFRPKYDLICKSCNYLFTSIQVKDIERHLNDLGIKLDTSQSGYMNGICTYNYTVEVMPELSFEGVSSIDACFHSAKKLKTIRKMILKSDGSQTINQYIFNHCESLENIVIEGVLGVTVHFNSSPNLSRASIESIVSSLSDTVTGQRITFMNAAKTKAFTDAEWSALIATKPNWTFTLV